jgi:hypothetical protein
MAVETIRSLSRGILPRDLLWTWEGRCFGHRPGDSLFTRHGIEVGRFSGPEAPGIDGSHLEELAVTRSYKRSPRAAIFAPVLKRLHARIRDRKGLVFYCGYEPFPSPEMVISKPRRSTHADQLC